MGHGLSPEQGEELVAAKPGLVINSAAFDVEGVEDDEATALKVNADAPRALAKAASSVSQFSNLNRLRVRWSQRRSLC